jgi:DNA repair exonuclease SbcCD ATPase subunit
LEIVQNPAAAAEWIPKIPWSADIIGGWSRNLSANLRRESMCAKKTAEPNEEQISDGFESTEKLERIREIVFGAQMREYTQRFENLNRDVERLQQENARLNEQLAEQNRLLAQQLSEQNSQLISSIQEQGGNLNQKLQELDNRQGSQVRALDERLSAQLQDSEKRHSARMQDLDSKYAQRSDELQRSLRESEESIRVDLRQNAEALGHAKVDRVSFGDMLVQLGDSLKDSQNSGMVVDLLEDLMDEID